MEREVPVVVAEVEARHRGASRCDCVCPKVCSVLPPVTIEKQTVAQYEEVNGS